MLQNNLLIERLYEKIRQHNNDVKNKIEKVAVWQNFISILYVIFSVGIFVLTDNVLGGRAELVEGIPNKIWSLILTLALLIVSFPLASYYMGSKNKSLGIDLNDIDPQFDYQGKWKYITSFRVLSKNDNSKEYKLLFDNMDGFIEEGMSIWIQKASELVIEQAYTGELEDKEDTREHTKVRWNSSPVVFAKNTIEWHFSGTISWKGKDTMANVFIGTETYDVVSHDENGRPNALKGLLKGYIHCGENFYAVEADSTFDKIEYLKF